MEFRGSERSTLGVEMELALVDPDGRGLVCAASEVIAELGQGPAAGTHPRIKHELYESTVEIVTGVCGSVADARHDLAVEVSELLDVLEPRGIGVVSTGLHPFTPWHQLAYSPGERYAEIVEQIQWPVRRLATHGLHVHVGVRSAETAIGVTGALTTYLPVLLALSASSPYWHGQDTGIASARAVVFGAMPRTGLPPPLTDWAEFEALLAAMIRTGTVQSVREIWWDVRPHPDFGTVELRMCDAVPTLREAMALAALGQCLVTELAERVDAGDRPPRLPEWVLRENKWRAVRYGTDAEVILDADGRSQPLAELAAGLVAELAPVAERLGCAEDLADIGLILERGPGYVRQRSVVDAGGSLEDVVDLLRRELLTDRPGG
ncbi:MAG: glutamate--cysteine ligase [Candidatus Nanopelagicales bacterium]